MPKRFLNISYAGRKTRINITEMEDLSEVQDKIKEKFANSLAQVDAADIQLCDQQGTVIEKWASLNSLQHDYFKEGGACLVVSTFPSFEYPPQKRLRAAVEIPDLTLLFKSFFNSKISDENFILSVTGKMLPYPQDKIHKLYVRKCYQDIFDLLLKNIKMESFAISGTPGIGKSLFFVYILHRLIKDFSKKSLSLKPNQILYQSTTEYTCFNMENQTAVGLEHLEASELVRLEDTLYIIDGQTTPMSSSCITLFISSPRSAQYKDFVKQKMAKEWYFPVWTLEELQVCQSQCYPDLSIDILTERYRVCGGVARFVFHKDYSIPVPKKMKSALNDIKAVRGVKYVGETTDIFPESHSLLQILVGDDEFGNAYQFIGLDVASKYVGEQLWILHYAQMIANLQEMFGGSPNEISRHLFEIYGHSVFSQGGLTLNCRNLDDETLSHFTLDSHNGERLSFGKTSIPTKPLCGYYEPSGEDNFPAIDSLSPQGMFQFTVAAEHPIRGVQILGKLCQLFDNPKIFFVVPSARFKGFKKQKCEYKGTLSQFVLELPIKMSGVKNG